jgi:PAS domain S-box-containing protein
MSNEAAHRSIATAFTSERVLLLLSIVYLALLFLMLDYLRDASRTSIQQAALEVARPIVQGVVDNGVPPGAQRWGLLEVRPVTPETARSEFEKSALALASRKAGSVHSVLIPGTPHGVVEFAMTDGRGGVAVTRVDVTGGLAAVEARFQRLYIYASIAGLVVCTMLGTLALIFRRRRLASNEERAARRASPSPDAAQPETPIRTLLLVGSTSLALFAVDQHVPPGVPLGALYIVPVLLSLWSPSAMYTWGAAVLATGLTTLKLLLVVDSPDMWAGLTDRTLSVFAIWTVAMLGLWQKRSALKQGAMRADAEQAQLTNAALKVAIDRLEKGEQGVGTNQRLLETAGRIARLVRAARASAEGHWELDYASGRFWRSGTFEELLGRPSHDATGTIAEFEHLPHPDDAAAVRAALEAHVGSGTPFDVELRLRCENGSWRWFRYRAAVEFSSQGAIARLCGSISDIERERLGRAELERVRDKFERAIAGTNDGLWDWDLATRQCWFSPRVRELLGYTAEEFPDRAEAMLGVMHPDDRERLRRVSDQHLADGRPYDIELRLRARDGHYHWYRIRGRAERDADGSPVALAGSIQDIDAHRAAQMALEERENLLRQLTRQVPGMLYEIRLAPDGTWTVPFMSDQFSQMFGLSLDDLRANGNAMLERIVEDDRIPVTAALDHSARTLEPFRASYRVTLEGVQRWYDSHARPQRLEDGTTVWYGYIWDATHRMQDEHALTSARNAADAANRAKGEFLANMSHEIRTPMNGVLGMTDLLLDTPMEPSQRLYAETIRSSATALLSIINDILDLSKIEAGKLELESLPFEPRGCIEESVLTMAAQAAAKGVEMILDIDPAIPARVLGDPHRLRQIVLNLVGNAVKFTDDGEILIEARAAEATDSRAALQVVVRDTGIGMSEATLSRLFQPFSQADPSTTRNFGGTGLGLSIVRRLIDMMGGSIHVTSEPNVGTTFTLRLPYPAASAPAAVAADEVTFDGVRVLIVDDNPTNRRVLKGQLEAAGCELQVTDNAAGALSALKTAAVESKPFDVLIADDQMPGMDGTTLGEHVKADPRIAGVALIMLTSMDRAGTAQRLARAGFAAYLTKPVRRRELRACLEQVVAARSGATGPSTALITRAALEAQASPASFSGHVLVVEDNAVNQQVARRFLERLGCEVTVVNNGAEAVDACFEQDYALVLMDVQMPVMDGLQATQEIRRRESGGQRRPIIALTAGAMTDELERCRDAGMDGMLTKPIEPSRLRELLERFGLAATGPKPSEMTGEWRRVKLPALDDRELRTLFGDDPVFLSDLLGTFIASSTAIVADIEQAAAAGDRAALRAAAHKLKGGARGVCAATLAELAATLERDAMVVSESDLRRQIFDLRIALFEAEHFVAAHGKEAAA